jgi:hypothetical protein
MEWGAKKQLTYAFIVLVVLAVVGGAAAFLFIYKPASCFDGIQNQNETGVDCEGVCSRLCQAPSVTALWARSVKVADGVYHAVAMVQNPETGAGVKSLPYTFSLYDADNILVAERSGVMSLQPGEVVPLLEANIVTGSRVPVRTFVSFLPSVWERMTRSENPLTVSGVVFDDKTLRLSAHVDNGSVAAVPRATLTALLYGAGDVVVGASQTTLSDIPARGGKDAVFTWQGSFASPVVRAEVTSRIQ